MPGWRTHTEILAKKRWTRLGVLKNDKEFKRDLIKIKTFFVKELFIIGLEKFTIVQVSRKNARLRKI